MSLWSWGCKQILSKTTQKTEVALPGHAWGLEYKCFSFDRSHFNTNDYIRAHGDLYLHGTLLEESCTSTSYTPHSALIICLHSVKVTQERLLFRVNTRVHVGRGWPSRHLSRDLVPFMTGCQWSHGREYGPDRSLLAGHAATWWISWTSCGEWKGGGGMHQSPVGKMQPQPAADAEGSREQEVRSGSGRRRMVCPRGVWDRSAGDWSSEDWHGEHGSCCMSWLWLHWRSDQYIISSVSICECSF